MAGEGMDCRLQGVTQPVSLLSSSPSLTGRRPSTDAEARRDADAEEMRRAQSVGGKTGLIPSSSGSAVWMSEGAERWPKPIPGETNSWEWEGMAHVSSLLQSAIEGQDLRMFSEDFLQQACNTPGWSGQRSAAPMSTVVRHSVDLAMDKTRTRGSSNATAQESILVFQSFEVAPNTSPVVLTSARRAF
jgi:hypothetical protein